MKLDRHIGAVSGYHGFAASTDCTFFRTTPFESHGYPGEDSYNGTKMYGGSVNFDRCTFDPSSQIGWWAYDVVVDTPSIGGQSGSGAATVAPGGSRLGGIVWAVASRSDRTSKTIYTRLTKGKVNDILHDIYTSRPMTFDLVPMQVRQAPPLIQVPGTSVAPQRVDEDNPAVLTSGQPIKLSFRVANPSNQNFNGNVRYSVYLSGNRAISTSDQFLGFFEAKDVVIPNAGARNVVNRGVQVPTCRPTSGTNYLGVIVTNGDANTSYNDSSYEDAWPMLVPGLPLCP